MAIERDAANAKRSALDLQSVELADLADLPKAVSERIGKVLVSLLVPAVSKVAQAEDRGAMELELDRLSFALAVYQADHGSYPAKLADLVPKYVSRVPRDFFNDQNLHYRQEGPGFLLYSVGINGRDDGGKSLYNRTGEQDCDDLVVRVPAKKWEKTP
jgi:hypothetical protein